MRVLVACEFSNTVRDAFLKRGHDAYSCDLQRADHPNRNYKRHIMGDVRPLLRQRWDLVIAHPPCTYLCNSGVWLMSRQPGRYDLMVEALKFFRECLHANSDKVCVENPIMHGHAKRLLDFEPSQLIHPYQFGHHWSKGTYLWLRGLPPLTPTSVSNVRMNIITERLGSSDSKERSRTFLGIAVAMAAQWG